MCVNFSYKLPLGDIKHTHNNVWNALNFALNMMCEWRYYNSIVTPYNIAT